MTLPAPRIAIALVSALIFSALSVDAQTSNEIEVTVNQLDQMTVTLDVAGKTEPAVIDTAATFPLIRVEVLNESNSRPLDSPVEILGMDGKKMFPTAEVGPMKLGNLQLGTIPAAVNSTTHHTGNKTIIPLGALPAQSIDFDFQNNRIAFYDRRPIQPSDNVVTRVKYDDRDGLIFIPVKLNGKRGHALVDTGSDVTYVNSVFAKHARAKPEPQKTRILFGTNSSGVDVKVFSAKRFQIGSHSMRQFDILSADPPLFDHLGIADQPTMVIGLDFLRQFRFQIDRKNQAVLLGRQLPPGSIGRHSISPQHGRAPRY